MKSKSSIRGSVPASVISVIAFAVIVIAGLWYMSYASKVNIDRILEQNAIET